MSHHQRPHGLRLAISSEAEALFSDFGGEAYAEACRRASEASSDSLASGLTAKIGNKRFRFGGNREPQLMWSLVIRHLGNSCPPSLFNPILSTTPRVAP